VGGCFVSVAVVDTVLLEVRTSWPPPGR
jgi:hypothetical protein